MWHSPACGSSLQANIERILLQVGFDRRRLHGGTFEGSALQPLLIGTYSSAATSTAGPSALETSSNEGLEAARQAFRSLSRHSPHSPQTVGLVPDVAIAQAMRVLPGGEPDPTRTAQVLRDLERQGLLGERDGMSMLMLDTSQLVAIFTVLLNPLTLLHGPPGTGKTTTICGLLYFLKQWGHRGRILVTAQSNVAVDNVLEGPLGSE